MFTPFWKLLEIAEKVKLKLPIEVNEIVSTSYFANFWRKQSTTNKNSSDGDAGGDEDTNQTRYFTAPYTSAMHSKFARFFNKDDPEDTLSVRNRCLLTYEILNRTSYSKLDYQISSYQDDEEKKGSGERIGIDHLLGNGTFQAAFPLHEDYDQNLEPNHDIKTTRQVRK